MYMYIKYILRCYKYNNLLTAEQTIGCGSILLAHYICEAVLWYLEWYALHERRALRLWVG